MQEKIKEILDQIETVIVGKNAVMERILMAILAGGHVLMEDVPGVGKTTTAMTFARVLGLETRRVQFTSDTPAGSHEFRCRRSDRDTPHSYTAQECDLCCNAHP